LGLFNLLKRQMPYGRTRDEPFPICMKMQTFRQRRTKIQLKRESWRQLKYSTKLLKLS